MIHDFWFREGLKKSLNNSLSKHFPTDSDLSSALNTSSMTPSILCFGHTHYPVVEEYQGILMVNPGVLVFRNKFDV
ncbi:MAG: hypothetical protein CM1200mP27_00530 [Chloroflexota bacterium]|nr:MAG: hypothetical protein CM1200mP27_00530 [Chloroflexota bacterium]